MAEPSSLPDSGVDFWTTIAAAAGSLLSLRTVLDASPWARMAAVGGAFAIAYFCAPALAELFGVGLKAERAIALMVAFVGINLLGGLATFGEKWRRDPQDALAWLISLIRSGGK